MPKASAKVSSISVLPICMRLSWRNPSPCGRGEGVRVFISCRPSPRPSPKGRGSQLLRCCCDDLGASLHCRLLLGSEVGTERGDDSLAAKNSGEREADSRKLGN